jgi:hypothetical protein
MNLIRVGQTYLNMDRVHRVNDLSVRDAGGQIVEGFLRLEFDGDRQVEIAGDSAALLDWLDQQCTHLPPPQLP